MTYMDIYFYSTWYKEGEDQALIVGLAGVHD